MKKAFHLLVSTLVVMTTLAGQAATITSWTFDSNPPDATKSTGTTAPAMGSGTATLLGTTAAFSGGQSSGADDSRWNISAFADQGTEPKQRGVQFNVSTLDFSGIQLTYDLRHSNTSGNTELVQYSLDGVNFVDFATLTFTPAPTGTGDTYYNRSIDFSSVAGAANNALFAFRIVADFDPGAGQYLASRSTSTYGTTGTWGIDNVTLLGDPTAVPEPGTWALLAAGIGALALLRFRRSVRA